MPLERTLSIVKPDAVDKNIIGKIYERFESAGLKIIAFFRRRPDLPEGVKVWFRTSG